jgi:hypothetical protein
MFRDRAAQRQIPSRISVEHEVDGALAFIAAEDLCERVKRVRVVGR